MSKNLNLTVKYLSYEGAPTNCPQDDNAINIQIKNDAMSSETRQKLVLPPAGSAQTIALPANPSTYLLIFADQPLSMVLNGAAAVTLTPQVATVKCPLFILRGTITSLSLSCPGTVAANVDIIVASP